jgi:SH3-like domain-containing protein
MHNAVVVQQHKSNYPDPVSFATGDKLLIGKQDTEYPGWVRVTDKKGTVGWAPLAYIALNEDGHNGVALVSYSATELDVEPGEHVIVEFEHCQWCWVTHKSKGAGWVPKENLRFDWETVDADQVS